MRKLQVLCISALLLVSALLMPQMAAAAEDPVVRVLLSTGTPTQLTISLKGSYTIGSRTVTGGTLTVSRSGSNVAVAHSSAGTLASASSIRIYRDAGASNTGTNATLSTPNRTYLGDFMLLPSGSGIQVINYVGMREYLYGAVDGEVAESSHLEILRAQTVISRCFALVEIAGRKSQSYDVTDTTSSQLYIGFPSNIPRITGAVNSLYLYTLRYGSYTVKTHYGTANGGVVLTPKTRWGGTTNYENAYQLRYDPFDISANTSNKTLVVKGGEPSAMDGTLYDYLLSLANAAVSGTATQILSISSIVGVNSSGSVVGLPTTSPAVEQAGMQVTMTVSRSGNSDTTVTVTANFATLVSRGLSASGNQFFVAPVSNGLWHVVFGSASGPRTGLSHRGAQKMAALGYSYVEILKFYYPGATLYDASDKAVTPAKDTSLASALVVLGMGGSGGTDFFAYGYGQINGEGVNLRVGPTTAFASLGKLARNTQVGLYDLVQNSSKELWYYLSVLSTGQKGYVRSDYVTVTATYAPTPVPTPTPIPTPSPTPRPPATPNPNIVPEMPGDVDGNGRVTAADAASILRSIVKLDALNEKQILAADVDGDGRVTAADAARVLRYIVKLETVLLDATPSEPPATPDGEDLAPTEDELLAPMESELPKAA